MGRVRKHHFLREHSLSLTVATILALFVVMYMASDPATHAGSFYGNAIADWLGVLVYVVATKYFFEVGSGESRTPSSRVHIRVGRFVIRHSLTIVLATTGFGWAVAYAHSDVNSKAGAVVGNILSDWTQVLGLVVITKYARERGSKEGH